MKDKQGEGLQNRLERSFVSELFKKRITNKAAQGNPYIRQGSVNYTDLTPDKKMVFIMGAVKDNKVNEALNELAIEVERIKSTGLPRRSSTNYKPTCLNQLNSK